MFYLYWKGQQACFSLSIDTVLDADKKQCNGEGEIRIKPPMFYKCSTKNGRSVFLCESAIAASN